MKRDWKNVNCEINSRLERKACSSKLSSLLHSSNRTFYNINSLYWIWIHFVDFVCYFLKCRYFLYGFKRPKHKMQIHFHRIVCVQTQNNIKTKRCGWSCRLFKIENSCYDMLNAYVLKISSQNQKHSCSFVVTWNRTEEQQKFHLFISFSHRMQSSICDNLLW